MSYDSKSEHFWIKFDGNPSEYANHSFIYTVWGTVHEHTVMQLMPVLLQQAKD